MRHTYNSVSHALDLVIKYHGDQKRKAGGQPVIIHLLEVANLAYRFGESNEYLLAAALCHDLVEDTECTLEEINKMCGKVVADLVCSVSNDPNLDYDWEAKKLDYIEKVKTGGREAQIICLSDKIANMRSLLKEYEKEGEEVWRHFNQGREKKVWFEKEVYEMLRENLGNHRYIEEYAELIEALDTPGASLKNPEIIFENGLPDENGNENQYQIRIENPTDTHFLAVLMQTGGFITYDEDCVEIESKGVFDQGELKPEGKLIIEEGHEHGISDAAIWFRLNLIDKDGEVTHIKFGLDRGYFREEYVKVRRLEKEEN